jgi:radical SAM superfamily enzyme with C-terminal helix-hairpin-helix motif
VQSAGKVSARPHLLIVTNLEAAAQYGHTVVAHHPSASPPSLTMLQLESFRAIHRSGECSFVSTECY